MSDNGNGHDEPERIAQTEKLRGALVDIGDLMRQDGIIAEHLDKASGQSMGVINRVLTPSSDKDYRQILKLARWKTDRQMELFCNALAECDITGADIARKIILDRITAMTAGVNAELIRDALIALTHTTVTWDSKQNNKKGYNDNPKPRSPISN